MSTTIDTKVAATDTLVGPGSGSGDAWRRGSSRRGCPEQTRTTRCAACWAPLERPVPPANQGVPSAQLGPARGHWVGTTTAPANPGDVARRPAGPVGASIAAARAVTAPTGEHARAGSSLSGPVHDHPATPRRSVWFRPPHPPIAPRRSRMTKLHGCPARIVLFARGGESASESVAGSWSRYVSAGKWRMRLTGSVVRPRRNASNLAVATSRRNCRRALVSV